MNSFTAAIVTAACILALCAVGVFLLTAWWLP